MCEAVTKAPAWRSQGSCGGAGGSPTSSLDSGRQDGLGAGLPPSWQLVVEGEGRGCGVARLREGTGPWASVTVVAARTPKAGRKKRRAAGGAWQQPQPFSALVPRKASPRGSRESAPGAPRKDAARAAAPVPVVQAGGKARGGRCWPWGVGRVLSWGRTVWPGHLGSRGHSALPASTPAPRIPALPQNSGQEAAAGRPRCPQALAPSLSRRLCFSLSK